MCVRVHACAHECVCVCVCESFQGQLFGFACHVMREKMNPVERDKRRRRKGWRQEEDVERQGER